jgi:DNA-binding LacI/PurR family transcriptional regulator
MQPVAMTKESVHTIADIARLAGVSKATVSRALNDSPLISAETKERIRAIAREHDFYMNVPARRLSLQQSHAVALVTYAYKADSAVADVFMLEIMSGISSALHANDFDLLVIQVDPKDVAWTREYLETGRVDGFILLSATHTEEHLDALRELKAPFIVWGVRPGDHGYCSVSGDSVAGGRIATEHLVQAGRQRIAFLGGPAVDPEVQDRHRGYESALHAAGRTAEPSLVAYGGWDWSEESGNRVMTQLLEQAPDLDAVVVCSDLMAIAAMDVVRAHGRRVPDDVAVIGYDDISIARYSNPPLTTIRQDGPLAGRLLAENLLEHLRTGVVTSVSIPAELVVRESA